MGMNFVVFFKKTLEDNIQISLNLLQFKIAVDRADPLLDYQNMSPTIDHDFTVFL